jgi:plasmid stabilization system protein ParE
LRVEITRRAADQIREAVSWWREHRAAAPELLEGELARALELATRAPLVAAVFSETVAGHVVRRLRLPRTRYAIYFTYAADLVTVHALWHGARGEGPPLP